LKLSISTVSKALHDSHEISNETKQLVLKKAKELNYQVNPFASGLRKKKSKTIAVVLPEVANNFFSLVINGVETVAQSKGYHVLIYLTHEDLKKEITTMNLLQNGRVDGVLISLSCETQDTRHIEELRSKDIPIVFFDRVADNMQVPKVMTDDKKSGFNGTEHLIEQGCKRIAFLSLSDHLSINKKRQEGYEESLAKHGIKTDPSLIVHCGTDDEKNYQLLKKLLTRKKLPDGIFSSVERLAIPCFELCHALNIKLPEQIKMLTFSNLQTASLLNPSLTTITQPAFEIGNEAASILFRLIEKKGINFISEKTILESTLIPRRSTAKN
jgi:LacI family transcriptional regulator